MRPAAESYHWSSPPPPEVRFEPPSEGQMAAWLCTIVRGEELAVNDCGGRDDVPAAKGSSDNASTTTESKGKLPAVTEGMQVRVPVHLYIGIQTKSTKDSTSKIQILNRSFQYSLYSPSLVLEQPIIYTCKIALLILL
jgi:hypothetical protein